MIKTIIFDLGGVIVGSFGKELVAYASERLNIEPTILRQLMDKYESDLQTGKINHIEFWERVLKEKNLSVSKEILAELWLVPYKEYARINPDMLTLVKSLHTNGYVVGGVSQTHKNLTIFLIKSEDSFNILNPSYSLVRLV